jgi:UDP-3-O-acyl N-acetylglucosamine deacetylase
MYTRRNQQTLARPAAVEGVGYWSGRDVRLEFHPAQADTGIVFVRRDLPGCPRIPATVHCRTNVPRRTNLRCGEAGVDMIEHVMATLAGLRIDNCEVSTDAEEMPGCDGSSRAFVEALDAVGVEVQNRPRPRQIVSATVRQGTAESWIEARPCSSGKTILQYELDYGPQSPIGRQVLEVSLTPETFRRELAACRTFVLQEEAEAMLLAGLGRRATFQDLLIFGAEGPIENRLRFPDECVRHKMLDMVGDLALAGCDLIGRFSAYRSGHHLNAELVRTVLAEKSDISRLKRCA